MQPIAWSCKDHGNLMHAQQAASKGQPLKPFKARSGSASVHCNAHQPMVSLLDYMTEIACKRVQHHQTCTCDLVVPSWSHQLLGAPFSTGRASVKPWSGAQVRLQDQTRRTSGPHVARERAHELRLHHAPLLVLVLEVRVRELRARTLACRLRRARSGCLTLSYSGCLILRPVLVLREAALVL